MIGWRSLRRNRPRLSLKAKPEQPIDVGGQTRNFELTQIDLIALAHERPVHFMGVGGAGMAPLAELVLLSGGQVTGCDMQAGAAVKALEAAEMEIAYRHDISHVTGCSALVITAAIPVGHPEIAAARDAGIPVLKRAEALGGIVNRGRVIGIAGTHGKTTTTALTTGILAAAGLDPTGIVGGHVVGWEGNLRFGGGTLYVVEADEYDRSFLALQPSIAVVTTMEADHLDIFGSLEGVERAFLDYIEKLPEDGLIVASADDSGVGRLLARLRRPHAAVMTYGTAAGSMTRAEEIVACGPSTSFLVSEQGRLLGRVTLHLPGLHNVRNALAAVAVARHLGAGWDAIAGGLDGYSGVERRFEEIGEAGGVLVVDDYAHHPTEITATLEAARASYPDRRLVAIFQPHLYSRTRDFATEFGRALAVADLLFVADIYAAREQPVAGVTGEMIASPARDAGADVRYLPDRAALAADVAAELRPGDLCVTLGAGDLNDAAREILHFLDTDAQS
jgi:UDP-N-acetylmuramate--alanine ligase